MNNFVEKLLSLGSDSLGVAGDAADELRAFGPLGGELGAMLEAKNGFFAFESALLVRPLRRKSPPLGLLEWNEDDLWRKEYLQEVAGVLFFAEDLFGGQFCVRGNAVQYFNPETGEFKILGRTIQDWANAVVSRAAFWTGFPLAQSWQRTNGPLPAGTRLLPKLPFVCGGRYEQQNLFCLPDVAGMSFRASIANQIRDIPDGASVVLKAYNDGFERAITRSKT